MTFFSPQGKVKDSMCQYWPLLHWFYALSREGLFNNWHRSFKYSVLFNEN